MAIVTIALPVSGIRGMLGGAVFSANRSGPYVRGWSPVVNPSSIGQIEQRGIIAQAGALWRTLSTAEQGDWDTFALTPPEDDYNGLNKLYLPSGFGWFTRILTRRRRVGLADSLLAPVSTPTAAPTDFLMEIHPSTGSEEDAVLGYDTDDFKTHYAILMLSIAPGKGTNVQTSRFLICWEALGQYSAYTYFGTSYFANFGTTQVGQRFFGQLYRQSASGIRSVPKLMFSNVT